MLMTVLRGDLATKQSRALIRTFRQMKDYIIENQDLSTLTQADSFSLDAQREKLHKYADYQDIAAISLDKKRFTETI